MAIISQLNCSQIMELAQTCLHFWGDARQATAKIMMWGYQLQQMHIGFMYQYLLLLSFISNNSYEHYP